MNTQNTSLSSAAIRILAIGDVHLGTRPANLDDVLREADLASSRALTPEAALEAAVDLAIRKKVDAVVFAGDVVESTNARFEALRPLEQSVKRLIEAGIRVLGVGGNHDVEALPRLAQAIEGFELLGAGGVWQLATIAKDGGATVDLLGWSFPERQVGTSPIASLLANPLQPSHLDAVQIGLVHGDLDATHGAYAPFSSREIGDTQMALWLLGHIHKPSLLGGALDSGSMACGYLGSLMGLTRTETGPHGPWLVEITPAGKIQLEQQVIAPLRWEHRDLNLNPNDDVQAVGDRIVDLLEDSARQIHHTGHNPLVLGVRLRLSGPSHHVQAIRREMRQERWEQIDRLVGATYVFVEKILDGLEIMLDLQHAALGNDPIAVLAQDLLHLEAGGAACATLLEAARAQLRPAAEHNKWSPLRDTRDYQDPLADEPLRQILIQSGRQAIAALLHQKIQGAQA